MWFVLNASVEFFVIKSLEVKNLLLRAYVRFEYAAKLPVIYILVFNLC